MISENMTTAFNKQAAEEAYASSMYLSMALWCDAQGYEGAARYLAASSQEEREHMEKFLQYVVDQDSTPRVPAVAEPPHEFDSLPDIMKQVLELEMSVASKIHAIVDLAIAEKDHATWNWLQEFVAEQREAEIKARNILDRIAVIGTEATGLYEIDKMLGKMASAE
ncbi:MAG: ferritin [Anaerolineae bacterium]|jgi:ferritin|nr:ferritin [Anaerolineae bacterium]